MVGILAGHFLSLFSVDFMGPSVSCSPWLALEAVMRLLPVPGFPRLRECACFLHWVTEVKGFPSCFWSSEGQNPLLLVS